MKIAFGKLVGFVVLFSTSSIADADIQPVIRSTAEGLSVQIMDQDQVVFSSLDDNAGLLIAQPIRGYLNQV